MGQLPPAAKQVAGGTQLGGIDRGVWEPTAAPPRRHLWRIARVVCGLTAMAGLHRKGRPEDERAPVLGPEVGEPVPSEPPLGRHDHPLSIRGTGLQKGLGSGVQMAMHQNLAALVEDADSHGPGMQGDATRKRVLLGGDSPEVSSFFGGCYWPNARIPRRYAEEGAAISITALQRTGGPAARCAAERVALVM